MSGREEYSVSVACPKCGQKGSADMSDRKSYKIEDYDTRVEAVSDGFTTDGTAITCKCGGKVR